VTVRPVARFGRPPGASVTSETSVTQRDHSGSSPPFRQSTFLAVTHETESRASSLTLQLQFA